MNVQNIAALVKQLQLLGLEDVSYPLLKRIAFKPVSFYLSKKVERGKDLVSLQIFFQKKAACLNRFPEYDGPFVVIDPFCRGKQFGKHGHIVQAV